MTESLCLHYAPDNASLVVRLVLEEMRLPYTTVLVDRTIREQDSAAYRALNPNGLIPALQTPDGPMFETAAILLWLADRSGQLAPDPAHPERARFLSWLFFASNTLHADLRMSFYPETYAGPDHAEALRAGLYPRLRRHLALLDDLAATGPDWLSPDRPSVLGYYLACLVRWMALYPRGTDRTWFNLADVENLRRVINALEMRPAARAAVAAEGLGATPFTAPIYANPPEGSAT